MFLYDKASIVYGESKYYNNDKLLMEITNYSLSLLIIFDKAPSTGNP
jgi:hypothetical protein